MTLTDLDGTGSLSGAYAKVISTTGKAATDTGSGFIYTRDQDQFEQTMAYYWVTQAQRYIQSLGFGSTLPAVNRRQQLLRINQFGGDNSFYREGGFGSTPEAGAIGEAFGDYLAVTVSEHFAPTADEACVADWDSTSYTSTTPRCLRRVDADKHYPEDLVGDVHADGEIWSRALWDIHRALGARLADTIIIRAQFRFAPDISMRGAASATIDTAGVYGAGAHYAVQAAFAARGLA